MAFNSPTNFTVTAPNGDQLQNGVVGTAYEDQLAFTIIAGTIAFAIGDGFIFGVSQGTEYATYYSGASGAAGIVYDSCLVMASTVQILTAINYKAEVAKSALVFLPSVTPASQGSAVAQLAALGIYAR